MLVIKQTARHGKEHMQWPGDLSLSLVIRQTYLAEQTSKASRSFCIR